MNVPDSALPFILMQRTDLKAAVARGYRDMLAEDVDGIWPWLPDGCAATLDLGCGVGGMSVHLWRLYGPDVKLYLLDVDRVDPVVVYGHRPAGRPEAYNSRAATLDLLAVNGVPEGRAEYLTVDERFAIALPDGAVDLVVSLLAWGYHWPAATYLPEVRRVLRPGGRVIFDLRRGQPLPAGLRVVDSYDGGKYDRMCCEVGA